jgi:serine acetyltransferase
MRTIEEIRKDNKPIIFLGSSYNIQNLVELCQSSSRTVVGLIDPDYSSHNEFCGLPVLDKDTYLNNKDNYDFFVATWWQPFQNSIHIRDQQKRSMLLSWFNEHNLTGATLVHNTAVVSPRAKIDRNVSIGALSMLVADCQIHKNVNIREQCYVSHNVIIESNSVLQIKATVTGDITVGHDSYVGIASTIVNSRPLESMRIGDRVIIHPNQLVVESVPDNTIVSYKKPSFTIG